jgi:pimeloyl-ACP methyl ester carboxylesterase
LDGRSLEILFLHALPLDGRMWDEQMHILPGRSHAPTLYGLGDGIEAWAQAVLSSIAGERLLVVGCSVGGSLALELAALAPHRVAGLVLIGTKAGTRRDPALKARVLSTLLKSGVEAAWDEFWAPLFSFTAEETAIARAKAIAFRQRPKDIARGVAAFHDRPDRGALLAELACPVTFVTGANDLAPGIKRSREQARQTRRGTLHVIPDCGHYVPLERPRELNTILREAVAFT